MLTQAQAETDLVERLPGIGTVEERGTPSLPVSALIDTEAAPCIPGRLSGISMGIDTNCDGC